MKPVYQTRFGDEGDCMRASIASVLELPLDAVPDFQDTPGWFLRLQDYIRSQGFKPIMLDARTADPPSDTDYLIWGTSPRGLPHSVVGRNGVMVHDPHPDGEGVIAVEDYLVFVPVKERVNQ